jgi:hypothetical protein
MHRMELEMMPPNEWGARMAFVRIDGRPLLEIVRELEAPIAAESGEPELAGTYGYLNARSIMAPSRHLLGEAAHSLLGYGEKISILECECGCEGCWPLLMRITVTDDSVIWSDPEQPHRTNWVYPPNWHLEFNRQQYEQALKGSA